MSLIKVLQVIPSMSELHGGPTRAIELIETALRERAEVTTLTTDDDGPGRRLTVRPTKSEAGAARIYCKKTDDIYKTSPQQVDWLMRNISSFDLLHIHALFQFPSACAAIIARFHSVPYVIRPLGTLGTYGIGKRRPWIKQLSLAAIEGPILRNAAAVHFTSTDERDEAKRLGIEFRDRVIPLGVEHNHPIRGNTHPVTNAERKPLQILFLSRLDPKKNIECLIQALALLTTRYPTVSLAIAGTGPDDYLKRLKANADRLGVASRIEWLGHVAGEQKAKVLSSSSLFVLPSRSENFGIAAVEAMLSGLPCVLSPGIAIAGAAHAEGAALIALPEPNQLADALGQLLEDDRRRDLLGLRGMEFAQLHFSVEMMAKRLMELYNEIISAGASARFPRVG
jgi:glycosyltransferase involved in cell wall biosynthesis